MHEATLATCDHATFESSLAAFLSAAGAPPPSAACFAVAGPVANDSCSLTNLSWTISAAALRSVWPHTSVRVINDFEAVGYGVLQLAPSELLTLNAAPAAPHAPIAVLGPGTGLGEALLFWDSGRQSYAAVPGEGAHADFAPVGAAQRSLAAYVEATTGECEVEQLCCGAGIVRIYEYLRAEQGQGGASSEALSPADVTNLALGGGSGSELAREAVERFLSILGAEAANLGLKALARGGVYVCGGIPPKLLPVIRSSTALQDAFLRRGCRFAGVRASMPLHVVTAGDVGLRGARAVAMGQL